MIVETTSSHYFSENEFERINNRILEMDQLIKKIEKEHKLQQDDNLNQLQWLSYTLKSLLLQVPWAK